MLIMHRSLYVAMPHCPHDGSEVPSSHENPSAVVMTGAIKDQFFRKTSFLTRLSKQAINGAEMPRSSALGWKYPAFGLCATPNPQEFEDAPTHRNKSSPFRSLAVRHKDDPTLPI